MVAAAWLKLLEAEDEAAAVAELKLEAPVESEAVLVDTALEASEEMALLADEAAELAEEPPEEEAACARPSLQISAVMLWTPRES